MEEYIDPQHKEFEEALRGYNENPHNPNFKRRYDIARNNLPAKTQKQIQEEVFIDTIDNCFYDDMEESRKDHLGNIF